MQSWGKSDAGWESKCDNGLALNSAISDGDCPSWSPNDRLWLTCIRPVDAVPPPPPPSVGLRNQSERFRRCTICLRRTLSNRLRLPDSNDVLTYGLASVVGDEPSHVCQCTVHIRCGHFTMHCNVTQKFTTGYCWCCNLTFVLLQLLQSQLQATATTTTNTSNFCLITVLFWIWSLWSSALQSVTMFSDTEWTEIINLYMLVTLTPIRSLTHNIV